MTHKISLVPLPEAEQAKIQVWLDSPPAKAFRRALESLAVEAQVTSGATLSGSPDDYHTICKAKDAARTANKYLTVLDVFSDFMNPDPQQRPDLKTLTLTT